MNRSAKKRFSQREGRRGETREIIPGMRVDRYKNHNIEILIDKLVVSNKFADKLKSSVRTAMKQGSGLILIQDVDAGDVRHYSRSLMCPTTGLSYNEPAPPHNFSFNSPQGACPRCKGMGGTVDQIDLEKNYSQPGTEHRRRRNCPSWEGASQHALWQIAAICEKYGVTLKTPIKDIPQEAIEEIMYGTAERLKIKTNLWGNSNYMVSYEGGVVKYIEMQQDEDASATAQKWAGQFITTSVCPECNGQRLNREALHFMINGKKYCGSV